MVNEPLTKDKISKEKVCRCRKCPPDGCWWLEEDMDNYVWLEDLQSAVRLLREIIEVRKIKNEPKTLFEKECYEAWNAAYDNALEDIKQVFGGCEKGGDSREMAVQTCPTSGYPHVSETESGNSPSQEPQNNSDEVQK